MHYFLDIEKTVDEETLEVLEQIQDEQKFLHGIEISLDEAFLIYRGEK